MCGYPNSPTNIEGGEEPSITGVANFLLLLLIN
jgi:hypothetical protein